MRVVWSRGTRTKLRIKSKTLLKYINFLYIEGLKRTPEYENTMPT